MLSAVSFRTNSRTNPLSVCLLEFIRPCIVPNSYGCVTAELEGFLTGLIVAMPPNQLEVRRCEPVGGAAVGDDVEETLTLGRETLMIGTFITSEGESLKNL
jgi:hypothetical protein